MLGYFSSVSKFQNCPWALDIHCQVTHTPSLASPVLIRGFWKFAKSWRCSFEHRCCIFCLNALTELIILTTVLSFPCSSTLRSFNMLVRSVKIAKSSSHWSSFSWLYSACLDTRKNSDLRTEHSKSLQEFPSTRPSYVSVLQQFRVVAISLLQMHTEQPSLKKSGTNRTGDLRCHIHYLFHVEQDCA